MGSVEGPEALTSTGYGVTLLVKTALIVATLVPAGFNLLVVRPRLALVAASHADTGREARRLNTLVMTEVALATGVLAAAAVSPRCRPHAAPGRPRRRSCQRPSRQR